MIATTPQAVAPGMDALRAALASVGQLGPAEKLADFVELLLLERLPDAEPLMLAAWRTFALTMWQQGWAQRTLRETRAASMQAMENVVKMVAPAQRPGLEQLARWVAEKTR